MLSNLECNMFLIQSKKIKTFSMEHYITFILFHQNNFRFIHRHNSGISSHNRSYHITCRTDLYGMVGL